MKIKFLKKGVIGLLLCTLFVMVGCGEKPILTSPDGNYEFEVIANKESKQLQYKVQWNGKTIITPSDLGFIFADGSKLSDNLDVSEISFSSEDNTWKPVYGEQNEYRDNYNEMLVKFQSEGQDALGIRIRAYNEGVAFKYEFYDFYSKDKINIKSELTEFALDPKSKVWATTVSQGEFYVTDITSLNPKLRYERPFLAQNQDSTFIALGEAALINFARMKISPDASKPGVMRAALDGSGRKGVSTVVLDSKNSQSPWRYIMAGKSAPEILQNNFLILNLNEPCKLEDTSWIKPGKVIREMSLCTEGSFATIDFAKRNNFQYILFDGGWYGNPHSNESDATTITPFDKRSAGKLEMDKVVEYAKKNDIGIILYADKREIERKDKKMFETYNSWGISGFKYGFIRTGSQYWTNWIHESMKIAAENKIMINIHDDYRPTGLTRTYPYMMTQEGIRGDEESAPNTEVLSTLFTRMIAGAGDQTNCYFADRVEDSMGSRASQMAKAICIYSPWQHLYWYDRPINVPVVGGVADDARDIIKENKETEFFKRVPTVWDRSLIIDGYPGEYALVARKTGKEWFVGAITGNNKKSFSIDYKFLDPETKYEATIYSDYIDGNGEKAVKIESSVVSKDDILKYDVAKMNGLAIILKPAK